VIGEKGWVDTGSYKSCFNKIGRGENEVLHHQICNIFKAAYYLNSLVYLTTMGSFGVYLTGTTKLMKLVNHSEDGNGCRIKFEDEIDPEN